MAALQCEICGGKLQGKPGGIFECDSCGMEYTTEWAKAKIQEIKGTVKVEGTVEITGTVKVEGTANVDGILTRAFADLEDYNFRQAEEGFREVLKIDPENSEAHIGLSMSDNGCKTWDAYWAGLISLKYAEDNNFKRAVAGKGSQRFQEKLHAYQVHLQAKEAAKAAAQTRGAGMAIQYTQLRQKNAPVCKLGCTDYYVKPDGSLDAYSAYYLKDVDFENPELRNLTAIYSDKNFLFLQRADGTVLLVDNKRFDFKCENPNYRKTEILFTPDQNVIDVVELQNNKWYHCAALHKDGHVSYWALDGFFKEQPFDNPNLWTTVEQIYGDEELLFALKQDGSLLQFNIKEKKTTILEVPDGGIASISFYAQPIAYLMKNGMIRLTQYLRSRYPSEVVETIESWADVVDVHATDYYTLALKTDGTVLLAQGSDYFRWEQENVAYLENLQNAIAFCRSRTRFRGKHLIVCKDGSVKAVGYGKEYCTDKGIKLFDTPEELASRFADLAEKEQTYVRHREEKKAALENEKAALENELANLKGLFSGKRRKEIESRLAQIAEEISKLS